MPSKLLSNIVVVVILVAAIILAVAWFYWGQVRPSRIYSGCSREATEKAIDLNLKEGDEEDKEFAKKGRYDQESYNVYYNRCLRNNGINAKDVK
jgi:uncharacterized protein YpmB